MDLKKKIPVLYVYIYKRTISIKLYAHPLPL